MYCFEVPSFNPNTFAGLVGKEEEREGGGKKTCAARPRGPGLEPRTCCVLGEGPQLHDMGVV